MLHSLVNIFYKCQDFVTFSNGMLFYAEPRGRAVQGMSLRPLACWNYGFESRRGHGCLSFVSVVFYQEEISRVGPVTRPEKSYRVPCV